MTESEPAKISLGSALQSVMLTPGELHVMLSALGSISGHEQIIAAMREAADDAAYEKKKPESKSTTSTAASSKVSISAA